MRKIYCFFLLVILIASQSACVRENKNNASKLVLDMVHHNPGEAFTKTRFTDPEFLKDFDYNGQVINDFRFVHCAITYDSLDKNIFPEGSESRAWVLNLAAHIDTMIYNCHKNGLKAYYFTDIIVLPKRMVELHGSEICDETGRIDFMRPKTQEIHRIMIKEIFDRFPDLDGLVIRVGETYKQNVPYHTGNGPVKRDDKNWIHGEGHLSDGGENVHVALINLLRDEVCEKRNKTLIYRTWDFGFFHTQPKYYLTVTDHVQPHKNLYFSIKHVQGDYHRTYKFNPTLGIGKHKQIVEVQCQREYEGKGAYPNYIADGVINGFEEQKKDSLPDGLNALNNNPFFAGVWTWSRGGGWRGPYIKNELWCDLNAYVVSHWSNDPGRTEAYYFNQWAEQKGFTNENAGRMRRLSLLSAKAIVRGIGSLVMPVNIWWTRDEFIAGCEMLDETFDQIIKANKIDTMLAEKNESVRIWQQMKLIADSIQCPDQNDENYIRTSVEYGYKLYSIYEQVWIVLLKGRAGDLTGEYDTAVIRQAIQRYDSLWKAYNSMATSYPDCATLYKPFAFENVPPAFFGEKGAEESINKYRFLLENKVSNTESNINFQLFLN